MTDALAVTGLSKSFGKPAVDNLNLTVKAGEFYALLGAERRGEDHDPSHDRWPA